MTADLPSTDHPVVPLLGTTALISFGIGLVQLFAGLAAWREPRPDGVSLWVGPSLLVLAAVLVLAIRGLREGRVWGAALAVGAALAALVGLAAHEAHPLLLSLPLAAAVGSIVGARGVVRR